MYLALDVMQQPLDYSRLLYQGEYRFRSPNAIAAAIVMGLAAFPFGYKTANLSSFPAQRAALIF